MYGFIYKIGGDFALLIGEKLYFLYDGISNIEEDVEIGNIDKNNLLDGYALSINKINKEWLIKDTGHKCCKDVIAKGKYNNGFEKSLIPIFKIFNK